jgi:hypothetical protein
MTEQTSLKARNRPLYDALVNYSKEALDIIKQRIDNGKSPHQSKHTNCIFDDKKNAFVKNTFIRTYYNLFILGLRDKLKEINSYKHVVTEIHRDIIWNNQVDKIQKHIIDSDYTKIEELLNNIVSFLLSKSGTFSFSEPYFNEIIQKIEIDFSSDTITLQRIVPIYGIDFDDTIIITEHISIAPLTNEEIAAILSNEFIYNCFIDPFFGACINTPKFAIIITHNIPKKLFYNTDNSINQTALIAAYTYFEENQSIIFNLLMLFITSKLFLVSSITECKSMLYPSSSATYSNIDNPLVPNKKLNENINIQLLKAAHAVLHNDKYHFLTVAIRRFSFAISRNSVEDKLIDLMICSEAIFLNDGNEGLRYRLSQRAALFLEDENEKRTEIYKLFSLAYDVRSHVVHGKSILTFKKYSLFINQFSVFIECLKKSLLKMLQIASKNENKKELIEWNKIIFTAEMIDD